MYRYGIEEPRKEQSLWGSLYIFPENVNNDITVIDMEGKSKYGFVF